MISYRLSSYPKPPQVIVREIMFCTAKTKRPKKDITVSAKVLNNALPLALYCCGNQSLSSLLYLAWFLRYKHFCVLQFLQKIRKFKMAVISGESKIFENWDGYTGELP